MAKKKKNNSSKNEQKINNVNEIKKSDEIKDSQNDAIKTEALEKDSEKKDSENKGSSENEDSLDTKQKKTALEKIKYALKYSIHTWIGRCFLIGLGMELVLEILGRRSFLGGFKFLIGSPLVFLYNASIIFFTLLFALFLRKRVFGLIIISVLWLTCGIVNFVVLGYRVTPFAAIDFLMVEDVLSMIDVYFKPWQLVLLAIAAVAVIILLIWLFRKTPKFEGKRHVLRTMLVCVLAWGVVIWTTNFYVKHNIISDDFANLGMAYKDYGFAYCFTNSIIDNGIGKPDDYSEETMLAIKKDLDAVHKYGAVKDANVIFIQLESFFDPNDVVGLTLSEDPIPTFTMLKEKYPSGYLTVPALGAGTANTEFEVLTGIRSNFFGAGEYPYKTTVCDTPVEGLCSILKADGYGTYAIHNNKSSFYDRRHVYEEMGFDAFISLEYMYDIERTSTGWAKDKTLVSDIMKCLKDTDTFDLVYTISVQGHGRYPYEYDACEDHVQLTYDVADVENQFHYYVNQIHEMDDMIADLIKELDAYGEDYVLVLYGDHLPTLDLTEEQLPNSTLFQTEYIIVNNIDLDIEDEDVYAYQLGTKVLDAMNVAGDYATKAQYKYAENDELMQHNLLLIAYDMLYGERYLYDGERPYPENHMNMGVDVVAIDTVENTGGHIVVNGKNFNEFSVIYNGDEEMKTTYVSRNVLVVDEESAESGESYTVKQVDESGHILSSSDAYIY